MERLKLAIIGCGAVTEFSYLPAIARSENIELVSLVDKSLARAHHLMGQCCGEVSVFDDYQQLFGKVDAAIVALPNSLHAPVTIDLLSNGLHVLVEKPMALNGRDCDAMAAAAASNGRVLAVGMARRFCDSSKFVKQVLQRQLLGTIKSFEMREGKIFDWQVASDATFRKEMAGGGVLMDIGVHALDLLLWWFGDGEVLSYQDDSENGLEANCELRMRFQNGVSGSVELSRTRNLRNSCVIRGESGTLTVEAGFGSKVQLELLGAQDHFSGHVFPPDCKVQPVERAFREQLDDFAKAVRRGSLPFVPASEGSRALKVIERCYAHRQPLADRHFNKGGRQLSPRQRIDLAGKRVLVTGGTGFIGGCLVERLAKDCGAQVRVLVRNYSHAGGIARFPVEMVQGDITNPADVARAAEGCEIVFHCAYGPFGTEEQQRRANVEGTRNVLEAAARQKIERVVHLSTVMVYGVPKAGAFDEAAPRQRMGFVYADSKLAAEELAFEYYRTRGVPVCVIQPTTVYGPNSTWHTVAILQNLKSSRLILVDGGEGLCNPVYVEDVVTALLLGATQRSVIGEAFLISGEQATSWRSFYEEYQKMLGESSSMVSMSAQQAIRFYQEQSRGRGLLGEAISILRSDYRIRESILTTPEIRFVRRAARLLLPTFVWESIKRRFMGGQESPSQPQSECASDNKPILAVDPPMVRFYAAKGRVRIEKAKKLLGYAPEFDLQAGMKRTEQWARWANLIECPERSPSETPDCEDAVIPQSI